MYQISFWTPISKLISSAAAVAALLMALPRMPLAMLNAVSAILERASSRNARKPQVALDVEELISSSWRAFIYRPHCLSLPRSQPTLPPHPPTLSASPNHLPQIVAHQPLLGPLAKLKGSHDGVHYELTRWL